MAAKEAKARIKINKQLEESGWRFLDDDKGKANIVLEPNVKLKKQQIDDLGENFEKSKNGFIDFLLLDEKGFPLVVLEAKAEDKNPLIGKEQARKYAKSQNCRFVILSNGNLHYFWDLEQGNPNIITRFPTPESIKTYHRFRPSSDRLVSEIVGRDYLVLTQMPNYADAAGWKNEAERNSFIEGNGLCFLREYQQQAVHAIQDAVKQGKSRFLFEMATGTGKTSTAAAVSRLFLRTGNARRVLFLVDRLELEDQADKALKFLLKNDYTTVIYKENRDDWRKAEIVVTTVQSLLFNAKYKRLFSPTDFDLVVSDEAHRSIGGNARAVFEYFIGYKLGLTATPKDYLKRYDHANPTTRDPREAERRLLLDTYRTFGCESGDPTFRYSLLDGVKDGFLINPLVVDARTDITTKLLSEEGYGVLTVSEDEQNTEQTFYQKDFEKKFFSEATNRVFCETLLHNSLRDPVSGEIGKTLVFAVSQNHAAKLTQMLNELGDQMFPHKYQSDFAVQVTSLIPDAQQSTINFSDKSNNLMGSANFIETYKTSKARVCVTVGMMTTGYDCTDILNIALMRPVFSPSDFVQIKGRGTRKHNFLKQLHDAELKSLVREPEKTRYKLFDFFANCEYFEEKFNYDQVLKLPRPSAGGEGTEPPLPPPPPTGNHISTLPDAVATQTETQIGLEGMRIDRMFFEKFEDKAKADPHLRQMVEDGHADLAAEYVENQLFNRPNEFFTLEKLRKAAGVDRRLTLREILEKVFGLIPAFKSKDELLEDEFQKFLLDVQPDEDEADVIMPMKYYFKAYATDGQLRTIIDNKHLTDLHVNPTFGMSDFKSVPQEWRNRIPEYIKDYVSLNQFM
jgi:type I restriction enzyme R subunit